MKNKKNTEKQIAVIDCAEATKRFNDFLDNYLKGNAREELQQHISECQHCFDRLEFEQMLKARIGSLKANEKPLNPLTRKKIENILSRIPG